jgi:multiple sugar transport system permease protein
LGIDPLNTRVQSFFRAAFYLPTVAGGVVLSIVWLWILNPTYGLLNYFLGWFGIEPVSWLATAPQSFWAVCLVVLTFTVGEPIILFLAGLAAISRDLLESAVLEGASDFQITLRIRLPLIKPVMLFILATQTIRVFQLWEVIFMLTQGGPNNASTSLVFLIYQTAFNAARYGKASAIGVVLLLIIFMVTLLQMKLWKESDI